MEEDMEEAAMVEDGVVGPAEDMVDMEALEEDGLVVALVEGLEEDREGDGNERKPES
jgi:hypothetical protein